MKYLVVVLVYASRAEVVIAHVLLDSGGGPAAEWGPIGEGGVAVVVSVPERVLTELSRTTHDRRPLTVAGVDTCIIVEIN